MLYSKGCCWNHDFFALVHYFNLMLCVGSGHKLRCPSKTVGLQNPDHIILFQPYFSCDRSAIPVLPLKGKVLIVESNMYGIDLRNTFLKNLRGFSVIAVQASASLAKTKLWARGAQIPFDAEFISKVHSEIALAVIEDGLSAVINFDPERFLV